MLFKKTWGNNMQIMSTYCSQKLIRVKKNCLNGSGHMWNTADQELFQWFVNYRAYKSLHQQKTSQKYWTINSPQYSQSLQTPSHTNNSHSHLRCLISSLTPKGVHKQQTSLKVKKAPGLDGISPRALKEMADTLAQPLASLSQNFLDKGLVLVDCV